MRSSARKLLGFARWFYMQRVQGFHVADHPHFDGAASRWFMKRLKTSRMYLEFGSGGSTLAAARLGVPTIAVESDPFFARAVERRLPRDAPARIIPVDLGITTEWGRPFFARPTTRRVRRWRRYIEKPFEVIHDSGAGFPDIVLIDGRFRRACALETARQAASLNANTTICVDDYGDRPELESIADFLGQPVMHGRMAVFEVGPPATPISISDVDEAVSDPN
jgi:hypothetical protein